MTIMGVRPFWAVENAKCPRKQCYYWVESRVSARSEWDDRQYLWYKGLVNLLPTHMDPAHATIWSKH
jgi:hypothetical protein